MILKAAVPPGVAEPLIYTPGAQRALHLVFDRCAADRRCAAAYPDIQRRFTMLLADPLRDPTRVSIPHPQTGAPLDLAITDTVFGYVLRNLLMSASGAGTALRVIDAADKGDFTTAATSSHGCAAPMRTNWPEACCFRYGGSIPARQRPRS